MMDFADFEGNNGHEAVTSGSPPFTLMAETAGPWGNITTTADVVFSGCPSFNDGNSWIGQPGAPPSVTRMPAWCYGKAYPSSAVVYSGNIHVPDAGLPSHAVLVTALDGAMFFGNALNGYINTRVYEYTPAQQACGKAFPPSDESNHNPALVGIHVNVGDDNFLVRHLTFEANDGWCYQTKWPAGGNATAPPRSLSNGGAIKLIWPWGAMPNPRRGSQSTLAGALNLGTIRITETAALSTRIAI